MPLSDLVPGAHLALLTEDEAAGIEGRRAGLELRDTILVLLPGPRSAFIFLFRKPIQGSTVFEQMACTGTGGLNVEACRVQAGEPVQRAAGALGGYHGSPTAYERGTGRIYDNLGRWPPNVLLVHTMGCQRVGTQTVRKQGGDGVASKTRRTEARTTFGTFAPEPEPRGSHYQDGTETVTTWCCAPGCPVPLLDALSGERRSAGDYPSTSTSDGNRNTFGSGLGRQGQLYADVGGASRFYPQLKGEAELTAWIEGLISSGA